MLTRAQKQDQVADLREKFGRATTVFLADYRGLSVGAIDQLRETLRVEGKGEFEYRVVKNRLVRLAVAGMDVESLSGHFEGPTAIALSYGDAVRLAKVLVDYSKEHEVFGLRAGLVEGRAIGPQEIATLATLPTLEQLRARLISLILAPAQRIAGALSAPGGQIARLVEARRQQLEEAR